LSARSNCFQRRSFDANTRGLDVLKECEHLFEGWTRRRSWKTVVGHFSDLTNLNESFPHYHLVAQDVFFVLAFSCDRETFRHPDTLPAIQLAGCSFWRGEFQSFFITSVHSSRDLRLSPVSASVAGFGTPLIDHPERPFAFSSRSFW